ncbi:MAG: chemotaxis protein CheW [Gammaproteobacteria bacterium SG8_11]|nr:MAG: chemotaxis protein CheW [Gammaproteobacteria bacterium SG8_11]
MAGILDGVDQRTQMVGANRLELLLFRLEGPQLYGINVFKVQEVIRCPGLTHVPNAHPAVVGIANMRGKTISVVDLQYSLGRAPIPVEKRKDAFVIIADYNRTLQGFLVHDVERIINMNWEDILPPPRGSGRSHYLTAVTKLENKLVEIVDVEKVLSEITGQNEEVSKELVEENQQKHPEATILVADDSSVARNQIKRTMDQIGIKCVLAKDGKEALDKLKGFADQEGPISNYIGLVISDIEMPNMDGYSFTTELRKHPKLKDLYVILHTSLSGVFNEAMVQKVGANRFIPKFSPDDLANAVLSGFEASESSASAA